MGLRIHEKNWGLTMQHAFKGLLKTVTLLRAHPVKALIHENDDLPDCDKLYTSLIFEASGSFVDVLLAKKIILYVENSDKHKCQKYPSETHLSRMISKNFSETSKCLPIQITQG